MPPAAWPAFSTAPRQVGFQLLTNYESMFWRTLVTNDAWSLYEVLRSFCHDGNDHCYPSINLLMEIMGIADRRILTGRITVVNGVSYHYPGLIDILKHHGLIEVHTQGEGPMRRYDFHVKMTPGRLSREQVAQLPAMLQHKHATLIARQAQAQTQAESTRQRPPAPISPPPAVAFQAGSPLGPEGGGNLPEGGGNLPEGGGKLPPEQHPGNSTHQTVQYTPVDNNNNSDMPTNEAVVVALTDLGMSQRVAQFLAGRYSENRISEKIAYLEYLQADRPQTVTRPCGWLRTAIVEDFGQPDGFLTPAAREQRRQQEEQKQERYTDLAKLAQEARQAKQEAEAAEQEARVQRIRDEYGTTDEDVAFWQEAQREIKLTTPPDISALIADAQILKRTEDTVVIGVESELEWRQLQHPGTVYALKRTLGQIAGRVVELKVVKVGERQNLES